MKMTSKTIQLIALMVTSIMLVGLLNLVPSLTGGTLIENFDNGGGEPTWTVVMKGELGEEEYFADSTTYFSVPVHKGRIQEASVKITCAPNDQGDTLLNPRLDVGVDGDYEWEYSGKGYGHINNQNEFSSGMTRRIIAIGKGLQTNTTSILLPKGAKVTEAKMSIQGGELEFGEIYIGLITQDTQIYYLKSNGDGTFGSLEHVITLDSNSGWPNTPYSYGIGLGDFDGDNDYDIIANHGKWSASTTGNIYLVEKTGNNNNFSSSKQLVGNTGNYRNTDFAVGDFNNDKIIDFIESEWGQNIYYFEGEGGFSFNGTQLVSSFSGGSALGKDVADFNLDGNLDFVVGGSASATAYVFEGNGDGTFKNSISVKTNSGRDNKCVIAGDYNSDGNPDIIIKDTWWMGNNFQFVPGNGDLTFNTPIDLGISVSNPWDISGDGFDFDFDGHQDIIFYQRSWPDSNLYVYWGLGDGKFKSSPTSIPISGVSTITGIATPRADLLGGCDNLVVDIGSDGSSTENIQPVSGPFNTIKEINFKSQLESLLASPSPGMTSFTDDYGNTLYNIPIKFTASKIGNVMLKDLSIKYTYTTTVDVNPHNNNLVNELNDLIPKSGTGKFKVYFMIAADTPGEVTFSDLYIQFNEAPIADVISDMSINEGTDQTKLINLANYYSDDYDASQDLTYTIYSYTNEDYLKVAIFDDTWLHVNASINPDWHGETKIIIQGEDSESGITRSNEFKVIVNPVDDPPRIGRKLENIELKTNQASTPIDLDSSNEYYFYDVDSSAMFFRAIINSKNPSEFDEYLKITIDNSTNVMKINSFDKYKKEIPVRVYASDSESVRTMKLLDLTTVPTYQDFLVNITKYGLGKKPSYPPVWKDIEDFELTEDEMLIDWINLNNFTSDPDDNTESLTFTIESMTNSAFINVYISSSKDGKSNLLSIIPERDFDGGAVIVLRAEDDEHNYALEEFKVTIISEQDIPIVEIMSPASDSVVTGEVIISGRAYDPENALESVDIMIGNNPWTKVDGLSYWSYSWDSTQYTTTTDIITIKARAKDYDSMFSEWDIIQLQINNAILDSDNDEVPDIYDAFPFDPTDWQDSDGDGVGDNSDLFPEEPTQWEDADGDGYGDNPSGSEPDMFPLDPTQWYDADGDGFGDNLEGNNPDFYPENAKKHAESDEEGKEDILSTKNLIWLAIIPFIIIDILILVFYFTRRKKKLSEEENDDKNE